MGGINRVRALLLMLFALDPRLLPAQSTGSELLAEPFQVLPRAAAELDLVRPSACDPSWDGIVFGIPTGAFLGLLTFAGVSLAQGLRTGFDCREDDWCPSKDGLRLFLIAGAGAGGVGGYVFDERSCETSGSGMDRDR